MIAVAAADRSASVFRTSLIAPRANYCWCNLVAQAELINQFSILSSDGCDNSGWLEPSPPRRSAAISVVSIFIRSLPLPAAAKLCLCLATVETGDEHLQQLVL